MFMPLSAELKTRRVQASHQDRFFFFITNTASEGGGGKIKQV